MKSWKRACVFWIVVSAVLAFLLGITVPIACGAELKLYDSMSFTDKPASVKLGCIHTQAIYQWGLYGGADNPDKDYTQPNGKYFRLKAKELEDRGEVTAWVDIESWPLGGKNRDPAWNEKYMRNKLATIRLMKDAAPGIDWQFYNWRAAGFVFWDMARDKMTVEKWWAWQKFNEKYALPVLKAQDAIFPDCYIQKGMIKKGQWQRIMKSRILEIKRLVPDKPIYVFMCFRLSNGKEDFVDAGEMRIALALLKEWGVDGFVLWSRPWPWIQVPWTHPKVQALWTVFKEAAQ